MQNQICVIIGASHGGVNLAFSLRREGWEGRILLIDADPSLPYHRPPLSKTFLTSGEEVEKFSLKPVEAYQKEKIDLLLGQVVLKIDKQLKQITLDNSEIISYDKLILATGARALIPSIKGINTASNVFPLRTAKDVINIKSAINRAKNKKVVVIGGGYIGLEIAASLRKLEAEVTLLERDNRILSRVTSPELSTFFDGLHKSKGVHIHTSDEVVEIEQAQDENVIICKDGNRYFADVIIIGVGIVLNTELAEAAGLCINNGIVVNEYCQTSDEHIWAIGDCTNHFSPHYQRNIRLESVQNAVDQAKVTAKAINGKKEVYNAIPWFWSDQYDIKLQMVGLSDGYSEVLLRNESINKFSLWYFKGNELLAVHAINNAKAYVLGTKAIKEHSSINKEKLVNSEFEIKEAITSAGTQSMVS